MITIETSVAAIVPRAAAARLAQVCTPEMEGHRRSRGNVDAARGVLATEVCGVVDVLAERMA